MMPVVGKGGGSSSGVRLAVTADGSRDVLNGPNTVTAAAFAEWCVGTWRLEEGGIELIWCLETGACL